MSGGQGMGFGSTPAVANPFVQAQSFQGFGIPAATSMTQSMDGGMSGATRQASLVQRTQSPLANVLFDLLRSAPLNNFGFFTKSLASLAHGNGGASVVSDHMGSVEAFFDWVVKSMLTLLRGGIDNPHVLVPSVQEAIALLCLVSHLTARHRHSWEGRMNYFAASVKGFVSSSNYQLAALADFDQLRWEEAVARGSDLTPSVTQHGKGASTSKGMASFKTDPPAKERSHFHPKPGIWCSECRLIGWSTPNCPMCHGLAMPPGHRPMYKRKADADQSAPEAKKPTSSTAAGKGEGV